MKRKRNQQLETAQNCEDDKESNQNNKMLIFRFANQYGSESSLLTNIY